MNFSSMISKTFSVSADHGSFHRFNDLPFEIRHKIWLFSLPPPRLVVVHACYIFPDFWPRLRTKKARGEVYLRKNHRVQSPTWVLSSPLPNPSMFSTCHEARAVIMSFYARAFASPYTLGGVWFDFERDTLCFRGILCGESNWLLRTHFESDIKRVRSLAIHSDSGIFRSSEFPVAYPILDLKCVVMFELGTLTVGRDGSWRLFHDWGIT